MKKRYNILAIAMAVAILSGIFAVGCATSTTAPPQSTGPIIINIGLPTPLSGTAAPYGVAGNYAYHAWIDLMNKDGIQVGGKTYNFKLIEVDDMNTPAGGAAAAKQLVSADKCRFIAGHWSENFAAVEAVTDPAKVIFMTRDGNDVIPVSVGGVYNAQTMPYVVFASPSHEEFINDLFSLAEAYPDYGVLGLLDAEEGKGAAWNQVDQMLTQAGIKFHHEWFPLSTTDFSSYVTKFHDAGCGIVYSAGWVEQSMLIGKIRWEMGYKDMKVGVAGPFVNIVIYDAVMGHDAAQGFIQQYWAPWAFKKTTVDPKLISMCQEAMTMASQTEGRTNSYTGWIGFLPSHLLILSQAMEKAGTVDNPDKIMEAIRGGTFDSTVGTWTMSGKQTFGSAIVFGCPCALSTIQGNDEVYLTENPTKPIP